MVWYFAVYSSNMDVLCYEFCLLSFIKGRCSESAVCASRVLYKIIHSRSSLEFLIVICIIFTICILIQRYIIHLVLLPRSALYSVKQENDNN